MTAGTWYFYASPVYPYPDPFMPPTTVTVVQQPVVVAPPVQQPQPIVVEPQTTPRLWYYCASAKGYFPYVSTCPEEWQPVPAQ